MNVKKLLLPAALVALVAVSVLGYANRDRSGDGCDLPQGSEVVRMNQRDFSTSITNPYWPMRPGTAWTFRETDGDTVQDIVVTVTDQTKTIAGIKARVVTDTVTEGGELVEDTLDWYAQDRDGNVWYLGEDTKEYEHGKVVSTEGSWEHGVDGALAGIAIPADPEPGCAYRQEYKRGVAEDNGAVLSTDEIVQVPAGSYRGALSTQDTTPLEPLMNEHKVYARGVGPVLELQVGGGAARGELVSVTNGG